MQKKLLIVDDEDSVRRLLKRCFEGAGYLVEEACDGTQLWEKLNSEDIDLITLDIGLGEHDGLELAKAIRQSHNVPIVMVTGKGDLIDTVVGLEVGADDYVSKPFELREVLARVKAVLRRYDINSTQATNAAPTPNSAVLHESNANHSSTTDSNHNGTLNKSCYEFNGWRLNAASRELTKPDNSQCELTTAEYELLLVMVSNARQVLSRDQLMDLLKGTDWHPTDRTIDNQISRLRRKLLSEDEQHQLIKTVRGVGYMFNASVSVI